jgi:hypothetical protein
VNNEIQDIKDFQSVALTAEMIGKQEDEMCSSVVLGGPSNQWISVTSEKLPSFIDLDADNVSF